MIPWGPFRPDAMKTNAPVVMEARNVLPGVAGFLPLEDSVAGTTALPSVCRGAVSVLRDDGSVVTFAGTSTNLYQLSASTAWDDVSRLSGLGYVVGPGEQWKFAMYGSRLLATSVSGGLEYIDVNSGANFVGISAAPRARYIDIARDFVLLGGLDGNEKRVQWSGNNDSDGWMPGVNESDYQDFPNGGPVRGVIGGEVSYVMQANRVTRMTYVPGGSAGLIFQFDEVEGAAGLVAPHSLVRLRSEAYYLARDGFRKMSLSAGASEPIGTGKWVKWFLADMKPGTELSVIGVANPVRPIIVWAYIARGSASNTEPNKLLIYDWSLDEPTYADISVEALVQWLSPSTTLEGLSVYGSLEDLPFSLDSPFWRGGAAIMGLFDTSHRLALQSGPPMAARIVTGDGRDPSGRILIKGVRPEIDTNAATIAISAREADHDAITYGAAEAMEDTGIIPAHVSGNYFRARMDIPAGSLWTLASGMQTLAGKRGKR